MHSIDLVAHVAAATGLPKTVVRRVLREAVAAIRSGSLTSRRVLIPGLGVFRARVMPPRTARNPSRGTYQPVSATGAVSFRPARVWRRQIIDHHNRTGESGSGLPGSPDQG